MLRATDETLTLANAGPETPVTPPRIAWGDSPVVVLKAGDCFQYESGACFVDLQDAKGRTFPIWLSADEVPGIQSVLQHAYSPLYATQDLLASLLNQLGGRVVEARLYPLSRIVVGATLVVQRRDQRVEAVCRPGDAVALARRFGAPVLAPEDFVEERTNAGRPPENWRVDELSPEGILRISRVRYPLGLLCRHTWWLTVLPAVCGLFLLLLAWRQRIPVLAVVGLPLLLCPVVWLARWGFQEEAWEISENALGVSRSFLGLRSRRRFVGAGIALASEAGKNARTDPCYLWVTERGHSRQLASSQYDDLRTLGRFLAQHTGWPLDDRLG